MKIRYISILLTFLLFSTSCFCQMDFDRIIELEKEVAEMRKNPIAKKLTANCKTDLEKVQTIFKWIADNISYDLELFHSDSLTNEFYASEGILLMSVLKRKKAVCSGYAYLFKDFCDQVGIEAKIINGYGRTWASGFMPEKEINHAWNAVKIDDKWHLLDVTWASGPVDLNFTYFTKKYNDFWFLTPPKYFIYTHFPEKGKKTLIKQKLSLENFYNLPVIYSPNFFKYKIREARSGTLVADEHKVLHFKVLLEDAKEHISFLEFPLEVYDSEKQVKTIETIESYMLLTKKERSNITYMNPSIELMDWDNPEGEILIKLKSAKTNYITLWIDGQILAGYKVKYK